MAGRGPAPKENRARERDTAKRTQLEDDGEVRGPELPDWLSWPEPTRRWWETWRRSPQAQTMTDTDWDFLLDTALLHARFWEGDEKVAGELRLRVAKFGATKEDRLRLREEIGKPDEAKRSAGGRNNESRYSHLRVISEKK